MIRIGPLVLLYLSAAGASCALHRRGQLSQVRYLPDEEEGWEEFSILLGENPDTPVAIAVDSVDEIYRGEVLPRAHGRDRAEMTARRLRQMAHQSPYRAALHQGPARGSGPRGDRYLIMGLTNPEQVRPWLDILHLRGNPLAGIWLLPSLASGLIRRFGLVTPHLLVVSEQTGGLRLSYLEGGQLRFSRLAPVDSTQYEDPLEGYAEEIGRTRQALVGQRLITREDMLRVALLDPLNTLDGLHAFLPESAGFQCESIERGRIIESLRLPPELLAESADALYLALLAAAPASANLMTAEQRTGARQHWWRKGLRFAAAAWISLTLAGAFLLLADAWRLSLETRDLAQAATQARERQARLLSAAGGEEPLQRRLAAVEAWNNVRLLDRSPSPVLGAASRLALEHGLHLHRLAWEAGGAVRLHLEGDLPRFAGDYQAAHQRIAAFGRALEHALPGHLAQVTAWPLTTQTDQVLEGELGENQPARFQMQLRPRP